MALCDSLGRERQWGEGGPKRLTSAQVAEGWADIDWDEARPEWTDIVRSHESVKYEPVDSADPRVAAVLAAINETYIHGGGVFGRFRVSQADAVFRWFASRNRFDEYDFFPHFLGSKAVREALPELQIPDPLGRDLGFEQSWSGALTLDGEIAAILVAGGAYERFKGTAREAKDLGVAFTGALVGERYTDFMVYRSHKPWAAWFCDIAWDSTWVLLDGRRGEVTLLGVTDTD